MREEEKKVSELVGKKKKSLKIPVVYTWEWELLPIPGIVELNRAINKNNDKNIAIPRFTD